MEKIDYVISSATGATKFKITDIKPYVPVVTLPIQDNTILLQQLKPGFKILCHLQSEKFESLFFKITICLQNLLLALDCKQSKYSL